MAESPTPSPHVSPKSTFNSEMYVVPNQLFFLLFPGKNKIPSFHKSNYPNMNRYARETCILHHISCFKKMCDLRFQHFNWQWNGLLSGWAPLYHCKSPNVHHIFWSLSSRSIFYTHAGSFSKAWILVSFAGQQHLNVLNIWNTMNLALKTFGHKFGTLFWMATHILALFTMRVGPRSKLVKNGS